MVMKADFCPLKTVTQLPDAGGSEMADETLIVRRRQRLRWWLRRRWRRRR